MFEFHWSREMKMRESTPEEIPFDPPDMEPPEWDPPDMDPPEWNPPDMDPPDFEIGNLTRYAYVFDNAEVEIIKNLRKSEHDKAIDIFDYRRWFGEHQLIQVEIKCHILVELYAQLGLHRYNLLEGTKLQFDRVLGYFKDGWPFRGVYFIKLLAHELGSTSPVRFQTLVDEKGGNQFDVRCLITRVEKPDNERVRKFLDDKIPLSMPMPVWPSVSLKDQFYELKESEWEAKDCCIHLYLKIALFAKSSLVHLPQMSHTILSALKIVKVVVETTEEPELPNATVLERFMSANFYITYDHDLGNDGYFSNCRAFVRRTVDPTSKRFWLGGEILYDSSEYKALANR